MKEAWLYLAGDITEFPLEARIFNSICVLGFAALIVELLFNLLSLKGELLAVTLVILIIHSSFYYLSRFANKFTLAIVWYSIVNNFLFVSTFYFSSGINGPTLLLYTLSFTIIILVAPRKQFYIWIPVNILFVLTSLFLQYMRPELIPAAYSTDSERYVHYFFTYLVVVSFLYLGASSLRSNYENERLIARQRNQAIDEQNQKILEQNKELAHLNSEKNRLFSIVAHDLRAPLDIVQSYLEIINGVDLSTSEKNHIENKLINATKSASEMLSNLLYWAKSQMEGISAEIKVLNLFDTIKNTLDVQKEVAEKKGISFDCAVSSGLNVYADANMLQLVVRNLIQNAIKFTDPGGAVFVSASREEDRVLISVRDSGVGIPLTQQPYLFTTNAKSTAGTDNERGTGLGLVLCKDFAAKMQAELIFNSNEHAGSTFGILLKEAWPGTS